MVRSDRPTVPPAFDVAQYAKDSDARIGAARPLSLVDPVIPPPPRQPKSERRLVSRTKVDAVLSDETWAGSMEGSPSVRLQGEQLKQLPLDHKAGFLMSRMDGSTDLETIVAVSAMPRAEALRLLRDLYDAGVIAFG
jgi:hypothetical protein